jgi:polysaccharide chain length determinant protein (PEP-CTERM system associated)
MLARTLITRPNIEKLMRSSDMDLLARTQYERDKLVDQLMKDIRLTRSGESNLYSVSYQDTSPERARRVVQNFVSMFVESGLGDKRRDAEGARRFIDEQIKSYEARMTEAENRMKDFRLENMELLGGGSARDYVSQIAALNEEQKKLQLELRSAEQSRDALKKQLDEELPSLPPSDRATGAPVSVTPQIDARMDALRRQMDEMLRRYTDQHPDVLATRRLIEQLEGERRMAIDEHRKTAKEAAKTGAPTNPVFQQIKIAISESEANVASLRARSQEIQARADKLAGAAKRQPEIEVEMKQMNRDYDVLKRNYDALIARREQASIGQEVEVSGIGAEFRLIDPPRASPKPVFPDRLAMVLLVLGLSVGGGLFASFAYAQISPTVPDTRVLRDVGSRPVLGTVSLLISGPMLRRRRIFHAAFGSAVASLLAFYGAWTAWIGWTLNR